jgi:hypothetical protein
MLALDDPKWAKLDHAYGTAEDIPPLLADLARLPEGEGDREPWPALWSALAHQGEVYPASFAAVPHVVEVLAAAPGRAPVVFFQFPAWVEICRRRQQAEVPEEISPAYYAALERLPGLVARALERDWNEETLQCVLAALAVSKGHHAAGEAILELSADVAEEFLEWLQHR